MERLTIEDVLAYEDGTASDEEVVELFAYLVRSGLAWQLQGHYGRTAQQFIATGVISPEGEVL